MAFGTNADRAGAASKLKPRSRRPSGGGFPLRALTPAFLLTFLLLLPAASAEDVHAGHSATVEVGPLPSHTFQTPGERIPRQCFVVACVEEVVVPAGNVTPSEIVVVPVLARVHADYAVDASLGVAPAPYEAYPEQAIVLAVPLVGPVVVRVCPAGCMLPVTPVYEADAGAGVRLEAGPWAPGARHDVSL